MKLEFPRQIFEKSTILWNPYRGGRDFPCGQTDMTKLIVCFRNFAKAPKNYCFRIYGLKACEIITLPKLVVCDIMKTILLLLMSQIPQL